jgi:cytochrome c-type biogenesis protein CcmH/NrfG
MVLLIVLELSVVMTVVWVQVKTWGVVAMHWFTPQPNPLRQHPPPSEAGQLK